MCYDIKTTLETQLKRAKRRNDLQAIDEIMESLIPFTDLPLFHASGFTHPEVLIYVRDTNDFPIVATWGLVPSWVKTTAQMKKHQNFTINARIESIFEKASFKDVANTQRCILFIDGFYEHHHFKGKTFPFYIHKTNNQPMALAGIWNEWLNPENGGRINTFSI
ncbi:MAG: SOS response-associated peptidase family protein, partial [Flavobacteriaceae bacterium]|nr:SOS response-associated peptidase family protein [Flavobacteriaceae bacterium]